MNHLARPSDWNPEELLRQAVDAAIEAGDLLRAEFHRPGGPRGAGSHAPIDEEIERVIRARLRRAAPDWPVLGEEDGWSGGGDRGCYWVIDPNDGTASFLRGMRGSAVSIGLVRDGLPVLGVVYAPTAPDDRGDLFAWAEGLPLTRNGRRVDRPSLPPKLDRGQIVLVSQDADRCPGANLASASPARFRAAPSVAYRLGLVAAGEGEAAVSLGGPVAWDLAAGHALLRAVGGELVDTSGEPIRYPDGEGGGTWAFAGSLGVARELASRDWGSVFRAESPDPLAARFPQARLRSGGAVADPGLLSRAQGCLLGQLAGDSLGSLVEFQDAATIRRSHPDGVRELADGGTWNILAGQPTDDSELALLLARTLLDGFDLDAIREAYVTWLHSDPFDVGNATSRGLGGDPDPASQANGSVMRVSPLAIYGHAMQPNALADLARAESAITHPHPVCRDASAAYCIAIAQAIRTGEGAQASYQAALHWAHEAGAESSVIESLEAAAFGPPVEYFHQMGWVRIALQNAFYQLLHAPSLEAGVVATVMAGGDTDTNAAIAGALLGAVHGREAIPQRWRRGLLSCRPIESGFRKRPMPFWPVDALELAERLLGH